MTLPTKALTTGFVPGALVTVTRPNNAIAYATGQVWGDGADARILLPVPAVQATQLAPLVFGLTLEIVMTRFRNDAITSFSGYLFNAAPTVLGDQAAMNLSDADIDNMLVGTAAARAFQTSASGSAPILNENAGLAGRRLIFQANGVSIFGGTSLYAVPGSTLYLYLRTDAAYNPLALEQMFIRPMWTFLSTTVR